MCLTPFILSVKQHFSHSLSSFIMKQVLFFFAILCSLTFNIGTVHAQDRDEVQTTYEEVKSRCADRPIEERKRIVVSKFVVSAPHRYYGTYNSAQLGDNMAVMLTNALQEINCFRVLEMSQNLGEAEAEGYARQVNSQLLIKGDITECTVKSQSFGIAGVRTTRETVMLGFVLKIVNPATRDIIWSKSVNVEGQSGVGTTVFRLPYLRNVSFADNMKNNPAIANALEQGILEATQLIVNFADGNEASSATTTRLEVKNTDYGGMMQMVNLVKSVPGVANVEPSFSNGVANLQIKHKGDTQALMGELYAKVSRTYNVEGVAQGLITLKAK